MAEKLDPNSRRSFGPEEMVLALEWAPKVKLALHYRPGERTALGSVVCKGTNQKPNSFREEQKHVYCNCPACNQTFVLIHNLMNRTWRWTESTGSTLQP